MSFKHTVITGTLEIYRVIYEFKRFRNNLVNDKNSDLADLHIILNMWKSYFSQRFSVHRVTSDWWCKVDGNTHS
jgi:hypothetical protein